jgi:N-acetylglucosamine-6-phosphate deacetylase
MIHEDSSPVPGHVLAGRIVTDGSITEDALIAVADGVIAYAGPRAEAPDRSGWPEPERLPEGALLLPGLVDLHCHGGAGADFPSSDAEGARRAAAFHRASGTTTLIASLVTAAPDVLLAQTSMLAHLADADEIAGIHWEGPFLSPGRPGAQEPRFIIDPDLGLAERLIEAGRGYGSTMTFAPERAGAGELVELLTMAGIVPSVGHTTADAATARDALRHAAEGLAGAAGVIGQLPTVTHLFTGMPPLHHREPGPVAASLDAAAAGEAVVELIADGVHLAPETVHMVFELLGPGAIALVTDAMAAAGCADGEYTLGPASVVVRDGVARLAGDGAIAGGTSTLFDVVRSTVRAGVPLERAVLAATLTPAAVLGLADTVGSLRPGHRADILVATDPTPAATDTAPTDAAPAGESAALTLHRVMRDGAWLPAPPR